MGTMYRCDRCKDVIEPSKCVKIPLPWSPDGNRLERFDPAAGRHGTQNYDVCITCRDELMHTWRNVKREAPDANR
jgi:hypothetical protein